MFGNTRFLPIHDPDHRPNRVEKKKKKKSYTSREATNAIVMDLREYEQTIPIMLGSVLKIKK